MNEKPKQKKVAKLWWIAPLAVCSFWCLSPITCTLNPDTVLASIPIGSQLSDLDSHLESVYHQSSVVQWTDIRPKVGDYERKTKYGSFSLHGLGPYETWSASKTERNAFTGELYFFHHSTVVPDDLAPSYVFSFIYVKGILKERDYGLLPG